MAGSEPNAENKLFVGGCPPGSGEEDIRKVFEEHGDVEEVFIMRGGSRSGMACAFVRFLTQEQAQAAIDTIHGQITLPNASEPLVVRWADAPGSRRRDTRSERSHGKRGGGGQRDSNGSQKGQQVPQYDADYAAQQYYPAYPVYAQSGGYEPYYGQGTMMNGTYFYGQGGYPSQQFGMMGYQQQAMMMGAMAQSMGRMPPMMQMGPPSPMYGMDQQHMPVSPTDVAH